MAQRGFLAHSPGSRRAVGSPATGCLMGLLMARVALLVLSTGPLDRVRSGFEIRQGELRVSILKTTLLVSVISFVRKSRRLRLCDFQKSVILTICQDL